MTRLAAARAVALALAGAVLALAGARGAAAAEPGVQAHLLWSEISSELTDFSSTSMHRQLNLAKAAGARYVRVDVGWSTLEARGDGAINDRYLARIDRLVRQASARDLELIFTFWTTPCWASSAPARVKRRCRGEWWERDVERYPPEHVSDYADALRFLVKRYRGEVAAWEVWNEPNLRDFFRTREPVTEYARLLKAAYPAAKRAHRGSTVIGGSLAGADADFTRALFGHSVRNRFDAWSIHPYSGDRSPLHPGFGSDVRNSFIRGVPAVRRVLERRGDPEPLWLTEFGWSTCSVRDGESWQNCVSETTQAQYLRLAFEQTTEWAYVDVGVWFNLQDTAADPRARIAHYGLLGYDGSPKPAYGAFAASAGGQGVP